MVVGVCVIDLIYKTLFFKTLSHFWKTMEKKKKNPCWKPNWFQMNIKLHESCSLLSQTRPEPLYLQIMQQTCQGSSWKNCIVMEPRQLLHGLIIRHYSTWCFFLISKVIKEILSPDLWIHFYGMWTLQVCIQRGKSQVGFFGLISLGTTPCYSMLCTIKHMYIL